MHKQQEIRGLKTWAHVSFRMKLNFDEEETIRLRIFSLSLSLFLYICIYIHILLGGGELGREKKRMERSLNEMLPIEKRCKSMIEYDAFIKNCLLLWSIFRPFVLSRKISTLLWEDSLSVKYFRKIFFLCVKIWPLTFMI